MSTWQGCAVASALGVSAIIAASACGSSSPHSGFDDPGSSTNGTIPAGADGGSGFGGSGGSNSDFDSGVPDLGRDPITCDEANQTHSYVGCDFWPTITANNVFKVFDYAVVVSNTQMTPANVTVTGPLGTNQTVTVAPGSLEKIYLPWIDSLKGPTSTMGEAVPMTTSAFAAGGAFHLVASVPVVVYQFNALEYKGQGGPPGKSWANCPSPLNGCFSYTNDASLLLPSTAWTSNYRVSGIYGWSSGSPAQPDVMGSYIAITAMSDGTNVNVTLGAKGQVLAGTNIPATNANGTVMLSMNKGDVMELVTPLGDKYDLSGSLVSATAPVQVITGIPCIYMPKDQAACDHIEESVMPAEALGKNYVVTTPTAPAGGPGMHVVRLYGNRDGTTLTYSPSKPGTCPDTLNAGDVADCGLVKDDFVVQGNQEFAVSSFTPGATEYDPSGTDTRGDPDQTTFASVEQYRTSYLFLAPDDYDVSYAVVLGPQDANPQIDGQALSGYTAIGSGLGVWRATLSGGMSGAHTLKSDKPVGLEVMGYGSYTSYTYPGGLNLKIIAPPPPKPH
jgi:hypothetical protein